MPLDVLQPAGFALPDFLKRAIVWPRPGDGSFVSMHIAYTKDGRTTLPGTPCETEQAVSRFIERNYRRYDVYVCMSTQTRRKPGKDRTDRGKEYAGLLKSLYLDVDVKPGAYDTEQEAVADINRIIAAIGLPYPTFVIQSGSGGRHLHWVFPQPIQPDQWQKLADSLANAFEKHGAKIDYNVGVDCSRVLRIPGTFNFKTGSPRIVQMDPSSTLQEVSVTALEAILYPYYGQGRARTSAHKRVIERPASFVGVPLDPAFAASKVPHYNDAARLPTAQDLATGCPWIAGMLASGGNGHPEPLWKEAMNVACHVQDGDIAAHQFSMGDPRYVAADTDAKYAQQKAASLGWPSCNAIARAGSAECQTCPHKQVQSGSPFHFMRVVRNTGITQPATPAPVLAPVGFAIGATTMVVGLNGQPHGYSYDSNGIVSRKDDKGVAKSICNYSFHGGRLMRYGPTDVRLSFETNIGPLRREIEIALPLTQDGRAMGRRLAEQDIALNDAASNTVRKFMTSWIETLQKDPQNTIAAMPAFGWHGKGFIYDGTLFTTAGESSVYSVEPEISNLYRVDGSRAPWDQAIAMVLSRGNVGLNVIIASALAGPLVTFTAEDGLWIHALSPPGGNKTTANRVAVAFWGSKISKLGKDDTLNSVQKKMETVRNITVFHDDLQVTPDSSGEVTKFAMMITSGQGRGRLTQDAKQRPVGHWSTLYSSNGNVSVREAFGDFTRKTAAAHTRVFEIMVPPLTPAGELAMGAAISLINKVDDNHGHAGRIYAKYLGTHRADIEVMVEKTINAISTAYKCTSEERFWVCSMAVILVSAALARHLDLIPYSDADMVAMRNYLGASLQGNRSEMAEEHTEVTPYSVAHHVSEYLSANLGEFGCIIVDKTSMPTPCTAGRTPTKLMIEIDRIDNTVWFQHSHFREWLQKHKLAHHALIKQLMVLGAQDKHRRLCANCTRMSMTVTRQIGITIGNANFPGLPR